MSDKQNLGRQRRRAHALFGAASLSALLALAPAEAAPRKRTPWVDPPAPDQSVVPEAPPATGSLPAAASPGPAKAEAAKPEGRTGSASEVATDSSTKESTKESTKDRPAATKAASAKSDAGAGRKVRKAARPKHVRAAQSRRAKPAAEARASQQRVAEDLPPFDDELTYDEVVRNGVEIDPRTIAGLPRGYRVYSLRSVTTVTPVGPPVVVMRQPWPRRGFVPYRRF